MHDDDIKKNYVCKIHIKHHINLKKMIKLFNNKKYNLLSLKLNKI